MHRHDLPTDTVALWHPGWGKVIAVRPEDVDLWIAKGCSTTTAIAPAAPDTPPATTSDPFADVDPVGSGPVAEVVEPVTEPVTEPVVGPPSDEKPAKSAKPVKPTT